MPIVTKTTMNEKVIIPTTDSILSRAIPVSKIDSGGIKVSLFGRPKTGKTRFISTFPKPILIVGSEDGTRSIKSVPEVYYIRVMLRGMKVTVDDGAIVYLDQLQMLVNELQGNTKFKTVAIDTGNRLAELVLSDILGLTEIPMVKYWGMVGKEQNQQYSNQVKTILKEFLGLRKLNVIISSHERNSKEDGYGSSDEMIKPTVGSALSPGVAKLVEGDVDFNWHTFIREEVTREDVGDGVVSDTKTGKREFCLRIMPHGSFQTGSRMELDGAPDVIVNPNYSKVEPFIKQVQTKKGV